MKWFSELCHQLFPISRQCLMQGAAEEEQSQNGQEVHQVKVPQLQYSDLLQALGESLDRDASFCCCLEALLISPVFSIVPSQYDDSEVFEVIIVTITLFSMTRFLNCVPDELQASRSEALGAPQIPQVLWGEVGGLEGAKRQIINTIQLPLRYPSLVAGKLRHSG